MISISEKNIGKESVFIVTTFAGDDNPNNIISEKIIRVRTFTPQYKGTERYLIYDSDMNVISDTYRFLNHNYKRRANNTVNKSMYAIKYLYVFLEIFGKTPKTLDRQDLIKLNYFLTGVTSRAQSIQLHLHTKRGKDTVNSFFSIYREYFRFLFLSNSPIFEQNSYSKYVPENQRIQPKQHFKKYSDPPKFISTQEFKRIIAYIRNTSISNEVALRNECLVRIMFETGMRLGEVLGTTLEDYVLSEDNGETTCTIYIRNRVSDSDYQNAKTCMNIWHTQNYRSSDYDTKNVGYQTVPLMLPTYDLLTEYIDYSQDRAIKKCKNVYKTKSTADSVPSSFKNRQFKNENYYVFINSKGSPLSSSSWNKELRKIFEEVGLTVDYGVKRNNLSHRFRHGFIMHLLHDLKWPAERVKILSRHKSIDGLSRYYNPTDKQIAKNKWEIEKELLDWE